MQVIKVMKTKQNSSNSSQSAFKTQFLVFILMLISCSFFGQEISKRKILESEYEKWGQLENKSLSSNGNWISFEMHYSNDNDTLFLKHTQHNKIFTFPKGKQGKFSEELFFGCFQQNSNLLITNLETGENKSYLDIVSFDFVNNGKIVITHSDDNKLVLNNEKNKVVASILNVVEYRIDGIQNCVSYIRSLEGKYTFGCLNLKTFQNHDSYSSTNKLFGLTAAEYEKGVFFIEESNNSVETKLHYYKDIKSEAKIFDPQKFLNFPINYSIVARKSIKISEDGKRIFFGIAKSMNDTSNETETVEVWDTDDLWIYPKAKRENMEYYSRLAVWFHEENRFLEITNKDLPYVQLNGTKTVALVYSPTAHAPHFKRYGNTDYYLYNLLNNTKTLFLENHPGENYLLSFSPDGKYICYFKNKNWWLYNIESQTRFCIEAPKDVEWASSDLKYITRPHIHGMKGWSRDGASLYLEDEYDVFQFNIISKKLKRLTKGRENNMYYSFDNSNTNFIGNDNYNGWSLTSIDSNNNLVILSKNNETKAQQYVLLTKAGKIIQFDKNNSKSDELVCVNKQVYVFREQAYNLSPRLVCINKGIKKVLYQSNSQDKLYKQGKVELITFYNSKGIKLQGLLHYPINYEIGKKYPLIVNVYSQISNTLHNYNIPSLYNETGFNIKHFVNNDYFVLQPDVYYYEGDTGESALDCVIAATNKVEEMGIIDSKRIGLIGHSFGGYETNYIITKTNKFAVAVSGAGISDMVSWYFSNSKSLLIPELWRSELQQWRIGKSIFENKDLYLKNSPILFADKVNTPLLTWVGKKEDNLPYEQSIFFYNALRRAGKKNVLLLYPNDNHIIVNKQNQMDLSKRISNWFDYYLKK